MTVNEVKNMKFEDALERMQNEDIIFLVNEKQYSYVDGHLKYKNSVGSWLTEFPTLEFMELTKLDWKIFEEPKKTLFDKTITSNEERYKLYFSDVKEANKELKKLLPTAYHEYLYTVFGKELVE